MARGACRGAGMARGGGDVGEERENGRRRCSARFGEEGDAGEGRRGVSRPAREWGLGERWGRPGKRRRGKEGAQERVWAVRGKGKGAEGGELKRGGTGGVGGPRGARREWEVGGGEGERRRDGWGGRG